MKRTLSALTVTAGLLFPVAAYAAPADDAPPPQRETVFHEVACPPSQDDEEDPPQGRLSYNLMTINSVHQHTRGEGIRIGLLDSGINPAHATLSGAQIEEGVDFTGSEGALTDRFGSGTTYASILVGSSTGPYPVAGVAPAATLVPIKILDSVPETMSQQYIDDTANRLAEGIHWAIDNDLDVVITALALPRGTPALEDAVNRANTEGLLVVAPVGDLGRDEDEPESDAEAYRYPAAYESVLAVTAVNSSGGSVPGMLTSDRVDVAAPGQNIPGANTASGSATCVIGKNQPSSLYASINAGGIAALLLGEHPGEDATTITHRIQATALRPEFDQKASTGWGIINPAGALHFIDDGTAHGPTSPKHGEPDVVEVAGREPLVDDPDPQRMTKPLTYVGLAAGGAVALALLLGAAGLWRGRR